MHNYTQKRNLRMNSPKNLPYIQNSQNEYDFNLHILSVHLSVKFACQMSLEYKNQTLEGVISNYPHQISSPSNKNRLLKNSALQQQRKKFIVNGQLNLQGNPPNGIFQITVNLTTGKGASYFAGVLKISQKQLLQSQGQILSFPLQKCLDNEATCQVRVNQTNQSQKVLSSNRIGSNFQDKKKQQLMSAYGNKIQKFSYGSPNSTISKGNIQSQIVRESYKNTAIDFRKQETSKVSIKQIINNQHKRNQKSNIQMGEQSHEKIANQQQNQSNRVSEASLQANEFDNIQLPLTNSTRSKGINASNTQNKNLMENTARIHQLELEIQDIVNSKISEKDRQKQKNSGPIEKMIRDKNQIIKNLQQNLKRLKDDKSRIQQNHKKKQASYEQKISQLKQSIERIHESGNQSNTLAKSIAQKNRKIISLESQNRQLNAKIQRLSQNIQELQKIHNTKLIQFQRVSQYQKQLSSATILKLNEKVKEMSLTIKQLESNSKYINEENNKSKLTINQLQRQNLTLQQQIRNLNNQISQSKMYKEVTGQIDSKIKDLQNQMAFSQQTQVKVQRGVYRVSPTNKTQQENRSFKQHFCYSEQIDQQFSCQNCRKTGELLQNQQIGNIQLQQKCKNLILRNLQLEKNYSISKIQEERCRVQSENWIRELNQYKLKQKSMHRDLRDFEQKVMSLQNNLQVQKQKSELLELKQSSLRQDNQDMKTANGKIKQLNEQLQMAHSAIQKERDGMSFECQKLKMKIKVLQQKQENIAYQAKQKQNQILDKLAKSEKEVITLRSKVNALLQTNQELSDGVHSKELESLKSQMDLENYQRQIKDLQEKLDDSCNIIKHKENELYELISREKEKHNKMQHMKDDFAGLKSSYNQLLSDYNTVMKTNQNLQDQKQQTSMQNSELSLQLQEMRKNQQKNRQGLRIFQLEIQKKQQQVNKITQEFKSYQKKVKDIISLIPQYTNPMGSSDQCTQEIMKKSRASLIDELDMEKSIIYQLPITHIQYRQLNEKITLTEMKQIVIDFVQESRKNISTLSQQSRNYQYENERLNGELAEAREIAYKNQQNLYAKMKQFSEEIEEMAKSYTLQLKNNDESLKKLKKQLKKKEQQNEQAMKEIQKYKQFLQQQKQNSETEFQESSKKYENQLKQLKSQIEQSLTNNDLASLEIKNLRQNVKQLQKENCVLKKALKQDQETQKTSKNNEEKKVKEISQLSDEIKSLKIEIQNYKANKMDTLKQIKSLEIQNNRLKDTNITLNQNVKDKQNLIKILREKNDQTFRQKQGKMKSIFQKESQILHLNQQISALRNQNSHLLQNVHNGQSRIQQLKEIIRQSNSSLKQLQDQNKMTERKSSDISERVSLYERKLNQKQEYIQKLQQKNIAQVEQFSKRRTQLLKTLEQQNQKYNKIIDEKNSQLIEIERKFQRLQSKNKKNQERNAQLQEMIYAERHKVMQQEQIAEGLAADKQELEKRQEELQGMYCDLTEETKEKQEKMFGLSSKVHQLEIRIKELQKQNQENIENLNAKWESKIRNLAEEYQNRINSFDKDQNRHYQSQKQFTLLMPQTHARDKLQLEQPRSKVQNSRFDRQNQKGIQRDRSHSPIKNLQIQTPVEGQPEKSKQKLKSTMLRKSRRNQERQKDISHQFSAGTYIGGNIGRNLKYFDSDQALKQPPSSYIGARNSNSRNEVRKYDPGLYRRNQRYN